MKASFQLALGVALLAACGDAQPQDCRSGADCASGVCRSDRTCAPVEDGKDASVQPDAAEPPDSGAPDGGFDSGESFDAGAPDGGEPLDAGRADAETPDASQPVCVRNLDGIISRDEIPIAPGQHATFRAAQNATYDTGGIPAVGGRIWDLSASFTGDVDHRIEVLPLKGLWFEADYPGASYATPLGTSEELLAVFELTAEALLMRGMATTTSAGGTKLIYDPPVTVLAFPFERGDTWSTVASVSGKYQGSSVSYLRHTYESSVDSQGELLTPLGSFPVLRIATVHRQQMSYNFGFTYITLETIRSFSFVSECYGTAASITSQGGETETEFGEAAEIMRLAP